MVRGPVDGVRGPVDVEPCPVPVVLASGLDDNPLRCVANCGLFLTTTFTLDGPRRIVASPFMALSRRQVNTSTPARMVVKSNESQQGHPIHEMAIG